MFQKYAFVFTPACTHIFIYSVPKFDLRSLCWSRKTVMGREDKCFWMKTSHGKLWAILHLKIRIMGAGLGRAEKRGFQTGQLCEKLIWENTKEWWELKEDGTDSGRYKGIWYIHRTFSEFSASEAMKTSGFIGGWRNLAELQGEREFMGSQLSRMPLSFDLIYISSRTMPTSDVCSSGPAAARRLYMATCACPRCCWPPAQPSFATPEARRAVFWISFLIKRMEIGPAWLYLGRRAASNLSIVFKFNSSGPDGPLRVLRALRVDLVRPHTRLWPRWCASFCEWAMCPRTPQFRSHPVIEGHTPRTRQAESRYLAFGPTTTANMISNGQQAFSSPTPMA